MGTCRHGLVTGSTHLLQQRPLLANQVGDGVVGCAMSTQGHDTIIGSVGQGEDAAPAQLPVRTPGYSGAPCGHLKPGQVSFDAY